MGCDDIAKKLQTSIWHQAKYQLDPSTVKELQASENYNQTLLSNADEDANADTVVTAIDLPVLSFRQAKSEMK